MEAKRESKCKLNYESAVRRDGAGRVVAVTRRQFVLLFGAALGALALDGCVTSSSSTSDVGTANEGSSLPSLIFLERKSRFPFMPIISGRCSGIRSPRSSSLVALLVLRFA